MPRTRKVVLALAPWRPGPGPGALALALALALADLRDEALPKNILMIGPTGVGKTEIARRLARLADAPFVKVEATKFTEVGYVGRDVEQIIRDLVEDRARPDQGAAAPAGRGQGRELAAEERALDALVGANAGAETKAKFRRMLRAGELDDREIELQVKESAGGTLPTFEMMRWIRAKHRGKNRIGMKELRRRFCDKGWRFASNGVVFTGASSVKVTRYRYRGNTIPTPWTPKSAASLTG